MSSSIEVTDGTFEAQVLKAETPVLVDFWAPWCQPCKAIAPIVEELAREYVGKVTFTKVNVDDNPAIASKYGVRAIPTLLIFKGGKPARQVVGAVPKSQLKKQLDAVLA